MNATEFAELLSRLGACTEAREWAKGKSLAQVWETCERADWMLWLCAKMQGKTGWPTHQEVVLAACDCAERALKYVPANEKRPAKAIEVARAWAVGKASIEEVRQAASAAYAYADATACASAANAAKAQAAAAYAASDATAYANAAAAAYATEAAAYAAAKEKELAAMADMVRDKLKVPL